MKTVSRNDYIVPSDYVPGEISQLHLERRAGFLIDGQEAST